MEQNLQSIIELLNKNELLSEEEKAGFISRLKDVDKKITITEFKLDRTEKVKRTTAILLEETIEELEQKRKAVEAQNRELEIESALERVRSIALSMKEPPDMLEVCSIIAAELEKLGVKEIRNVQTAIFYEEKGTYMNYEYYAKHDKTIITEVSYTNHTMHQAFADQMLKGKDEFFSTEMSKAELPDWIAYQKTTNVFIDTYLEKAPSLNYYWYSLGPVALGISTYVPLTEEQISLFKRFLKVFELAYTRYLNIEQAVAQAREAQIQLALERVRARTMAMQHSDELTDAAMVMFQQLKELGVNAFACGFVILDKSETEGEFWMSSEGIFQPPHYIPNMEEPSVRNMYKHWKKNEEFYAEDVGGEALKLHYKYLMELPKSGPNFQGLLDAGIMFPEWQRMYAAYFSHGYLLIITKEQYKEENIFIRFAKVFEQTYTRFLDLQKAEAQAREAKIEAALERVRAKTMAMHKSEQLAETAKVFFEQFDLLGKIPDRMSIGIINEETKKVELWVTDQSGNQVNNEYFFSLDERTSIAKIYTAWKKGDETITVDLTGENLKKWLQFVKKDAKLPIDETKIKGRRVQQAAFFTQGFLLFTTHEPVANEIMRLLERFARVFEQTYTRFLDLQKAEAQAREGHIEVSLEKVRSHSLAMHKSDDLQNVVNTVFERLMHLDIEIYSANIAIFAEGTRDFDYWVASPSQDRSSVFHIPYVDFGITKDLALAREAGLDFFEKTYLFDEKNAWFSYGFQHTDFKLLDDQRKKFILDAPAITVAIAFSKNTGVQFNRYSANPLVHDEVDILKRFSKVFEQAYTRFLDLQKAETSAREAQIQLGLERVRAGAMGMQHSDHLKDVIEVIGHQLHEMGLFFDYVNFIVGDTSDGFDTWNVSFGYANPVRFFIPYVNNRLFNETMHARKDGLGFNAYTMTAEETFNFVSHLIATGILKYLPEEALQKRLHSKGMSVSTVLLNEIFLTMANYSAIPYTNEENSILNRFGIAFQQAYTRFLDLQKAEAQARESNIEASLERVRSKTMAMHNSNDVGETVATMFNEFEALGIHTNRCGILIFKDSDFAEVWTAKSSTEGKATLITGKLQLKEHLLLSSAFDGWYKKQSFHQYMLIGDDLAQYYDVINRSEYYPTQFDLQSLPKKEYHSDFYFPDGAVFSFTQEPIAEQSLKIIKRFAGVFGQTYRRYLDLQKAEAQAREAQIETALEKVRSRSMGMQKSEELKEVIKVVYQQLRQLKIHLDHAGFVVDYKPGGDWHFWIADEQEIPSKITHPYFGSVWATQFDDAKMKGAAFFVTNLNFEEKNKFYTELLPYVPELSKETRDFYLNCPGLAATTVLFDNVSLYVENFSGTPYSEEENAILVRFGKVFDQTYTRFLDLKKAEAQARESEIELGLERVRARAMAMHKSPELQEVIETVFDQILKLGILADVANFIIFNQQNKDVNCWVASPNLKINRSWHMPYMDIYPLNAIWIEKEKGNDSFSTSCSFEQKKAFFDWAFEHSDFKNFPDDRKQFVLESKRWTTSYAWVKHTGIQLSSYSKGLFAENENEILKRYARVFEQSYTRFLDLQKAEAQAREAEIELGLERVRARAMAMQKSDELAAAAQLLYTEFAKLGISTFTCGYMFIDEEKNTQTAWVVLPDGTLLPNSVEFPLTGDPVLDSRYADWKAKKAFHVFEVKGEANKEHHRFLLKHVRGVVAEEIFAHMPDRIVFHCANFSNGYLLILAEELFTTEEQQMVIRFANVFEMTYTRFLDLQKAEAQAREAIIEAAMERVRGKAIAMHNSNDLSSTASLVFTELRKLGIDPVRCGVSLQTKENRKNLLYYAIPSAEGDNLSLAGSALLTGHPVLSEIYDYWLRGEDYFPVLKGESLIDYYQTLKQVGFNVPVSPTGHEQHGYYLPFSEGMFYGWSEKPFAETEIKILKRFASVIDLTFRRYMELQKSEANAREAVRQAALDRVRAEIASMRSIDDLDRITPLIWTELNILGVPFIRCGVFIMDDSNELIHTFLSTPDGKAIAAFHIPYTTPGNIQKVLAHWQHKKNYIDHWDESAFTEFAGTLVKQGGLLSPEQYLQTIPHGGFYLHFLPFLQGMLYVGNTTQLGGEQIKLIQSVADAFSTAYARYEDFNKLEAAKQQVDETLVDLKQAQAQLVQSEKMASLGELTAGIAHEIQNPLNFVNNFSEVSNELIHELKSEKAKIKSERDEQLENDILNDISSNLEKILHHGKRADGIVKGMLQHSRTSTAVKEAVNINKLADEYLRLAYHGLRAKDNSFNTTLKTNYDENIEDITIIPQDIARVVLNLYNNAFYAVDERLRQAQPDSHYEPSVSVSTKKINDKVEIRVEDNGNGMPKNIIDKIFQPFFTTKPTGQGTGLGLSLSYDIIKAHGGEIRVETKESEGTTFTIQLPVA